MTNPVFQNDHIKCQCGAKVYTNLSDTLESELSNDPVEDELTDSTEVQCPSCNALYSLELAAFKTIEIEFVSLKLMSQNVVDVKGELYPLDTFKGMDLLAHVPLHDGIYLVEGREYHVTNQKLISYWAVPDEHQISFFEEAA